jgi:hypothetical protein
MRVDAYEFVCTAGVMGYPDTVVISKQHHMYNPM